MKKLVLCTVAALIAASAVAGQSLDYAELVGRLTDLQQLAVLPERGESCAQWSSWDRASKWDENTRKFVGWDANGDNNGMIRTEGESFVMAEMDGPGCIWRIWSAAPGAGHVRIYLDGSQAPAVDLPFAGYFDLQNEPFVYPSLVHEAASGKNCYVPIPYSKSCKVVADKDWGAYYQFVYSTFPKGTVVPRFTRSLDGRGRLALAVADRYLTKMLGTPPPGAQPIAGESRSSTVNIASGEKWQMRLVGPAAISSIILRPQTRSEAVLRNVTLRIYWDGASRPAVDSPVGDFFGTGPGANLYRSLPLGVTEDTLYSYWYMPFASGAVVELVNGGDERFFSSIEITEAPLTRDISRLGRFHAKWHRDAFLPRGAERWIDWTMLTTRGRGRFCGVALEVWNPRGGWWGEGDEKFFVDGETFPSTFGTGSEDYFGYAWCNPGLFTNAFHNQTRNDGNNVGHVSVNRWHIADNIPFARSFDGYIEKYYGNDRFTLYACTAYWYLAPGGRDPYGSVPISERWFYVEPETYAVKDAMEGEKLEVLSKTGGATTLQNLVDFGDHRWSRQGHLWWTGAKPGDTLDLALPVEKSGNYSLIAQFTKAADYGIVQVYIDGKPLGGPIDLYNGGVISSGELTLGIVPLDEGKHTLRMQITGANDQAAKSYMVGLDYIRLEPAGG